MSAAEECPACACTSDGLTACSRHKPPKEGAIKVDSCRSDGRCPECSLSVPYSGGLLPALCGCRICGPGCWGLHERRLLQEAIRQRDAEKKVTYDRAAGVKGPHILVHRQMWDQLREERDAAIRQVEEQRHPCPCGQDTASIKWARCYSCRQREAEELSAAKDLLARLHRDGGHHTEEVGFVQSCADAEGRWLELLERAGK